MTGSKAPIFPCSLSKIQNGKGTRTTGHRRWEAQFSRKTCRRDQARWYKAGTAKLRHQDLRNGLPLLTQAPANDQFATVVMPHLDDAYALARWLTGNSADAEDIVQEACVRALRGLDRYSGGNARAWLLAITRNTAFTWMARNRPKALLVTEDIEALAPADEAATPEEALIEKADAAAIERAIGALPPPFKETLVLRDINGLSYREIAEITSVPVGTVMSRLARARGLLMAALGSPQIK
jgi:RNA polymerase sigma factor (sigma-70 family)